MSLVDERKLNRTTIAITYTLHEIAVWPFLEQLGFAALDTGKNDLAQVGLLSDTNNGRLNMEYGSIGILTHCSFGILPLPRLTDMHRTPRRQVP